MGLITIFETNNNQKFSTQKMQLQIRKATVQDAAAMMDLIRELAIYEKAENEVTVSLEHFEEAGFGLNPIWKAYVAEIENTIVGISLFYERYSTWKGRKLYLEDIVVTQSQRGKKIGKALFEKTLEHAKDNGFYSVCWQVLDWNEPAINFYKKFGSNFDATWCNGEIVMQK